MNETHWLVFLTNHLAELRLRTGEHILLTAVSTVLAIVAALPLGVLAFRRTALRGPVMGSVSILQTVPSLAMLAMLLAVLGMIGAVPAIIALTLYALLPMVRNTVTGIDGVPSEIVEAARGIGMTERQELWMVRMPLAAPVIVAGIRTAAVVGVGIATLSAFIGAGGLGQFINRGLALSNTSLILLGAIPAALLALLVDFSIAAVQWALKRRRPDEMRRSTSVLKAIALAQPFVLVAAGFLAAYPHVIFGRGGAASTENPSGVIRIGSKAFSEQFILGEMMAQLIESHTDLAVKRVFNLGGTLICHNALIHGEIDVYPEYTGTALTAILGHATVRNPREALKIVSRAYKKRFHVIWLKPFGFDNSYSITVRQSDAAEHGWKTISDLAPDAAHLKAGFTSEFAARPDGYPGLIHAYGFRFGEVVDVDASLMYQAAAKGEVDVVCAYTTDGRIAAYHLKTLIDDKHFFPPYEAAPIVREQILKKHPGLSTVLNLLAGKIDNATMRKMNYEVDVKHRTAREVAHEFLVSRELIKSVER
jgi:osmoprotectant transport system permease protein